MRLSQIWEGPVRFGRRRCARRQCGGEIKRGEAALFLRLNGSTFTTHLSCAGKREAGKTMRERFHDWESAR